MAGMMIDFSKIAADARKNYGILTMPEFNIGMGAYRRPVTASGVPYSETPLEPGNPGPVAAMNTEYQDLDARYNLGQRQNGMLGGEGGAQRSYVPMPDALNLAKVPETTYGNEQPAPEPVAPASKPQQDAGENLDVQKAQVEAVANGNGTIEQLLDALRQMAYMQPGDQRNPVFQLDAMYKNSDAMTGIPGTVAQYPTAGGMTRETDYNLGGVNGGI